MLLTLIQDPNWANVLVTGIGVCVALVALVFTILLYIKHKSD